MNQDLINQIFTELGIQNSQELLSTKDTKAEDIISKIREGQRVYLQSQDEFVNQFKEVGRQNILQEIYEKTAHEFQLSADLVNNKPIEDVLKLGVSKIRDNMSASEKKAEEMITSANRKAYDLEHVSIPQIKQQYERQISEIHMNNKLRELVQSCQSDITHPIEVVLPYVASKLAEKSSYNISMADNSLIINDGSNNVIRNKTKTEILTPRDVIRKILEDGKFLKVTPSQQTQNTPMYQTQQTQQTQQRFQQNQPQQNDSLGTLIPEALLQAEQNLTKLRTLTR